MNITYCDHCNLSIPDAHLASGQAVRVGTSVFCESCKTAVGVPAAPTIPVASPARSSNSRNRAVKTGISAVELPKAPAAPAPAPAINNTPYIVGSVIALLALGVFWQFVNSDSPQESVKGGSASAAPTAPVTPRKDPVVTPVSTPATPSPAPAVDPAVQAKNTEDAASTELDKLVGDLKEGDKAAKIKRVEAFLTTHGDTLAGARARVMLKNLNATGTIDPPAYVPPPPAPPAPPQPAPPPPPPPPADKK